MKKRAYLVIALLLCLLLTACTAKQPFEDVPNPTATITLTDGKVMNFELDLAAAPNTVANFVELASQGFYNGCSFYRVIPGALIQAGSQNNGGQGGAGHYIQGEFSANGIENPLSHTRGTISMCRQEDDYNTASSQFFIMQGSYPEYDGRYAAFGKAADAETLETIDYVANVMVDRNYSPVSKICTIRSVKVDTKGYTYEAAKIEKPKDDKKKTSKDKK